MHSQCDFSYLFHCHLDGLLVASGSKTINIKKKRFKYMRTNRLLWEIQHLKWHCLLFELSSKCRQMPVLTVLIFLNNADV